MPQGSVLGPILGPLAVYDLLRLVQRHQLHPRAYADDTQIYGSCHPSMADVLQQRLSDTDCIDDVALWMMSNCLQLDHTKTEVLRCFLSLPFVTLESI